MKRPFGARVERLLTGVETEPTAQQELANLKAKLRAMEVAAIALAQKDKEICPPQRRGSQQYRSDIWRQIEAARKAQK
jgi:hypothetical protein